jgi:hypothetical protein
MGTVCSWEVDIPCTGDAGAPDGGSVMPCVSWCNAVAPQGAPAADFCQVLPVDAGQAMFASCGGCGI